MMESWPIQCTYNKISWNHDRPWIYPRLCNYWKQKGNQYKVRVLCTCVLFFEASATAFFVVSFIYVNGTFTWILLTLHHIGTPYNLIYLYGLQINIWNLHHQCWFSLNRSWFCGEISCLELDLSLNSSWLFCPCVLQWFSCCGPSPWIVGHCWFGFIFWRVWTPVHNMLDLEGIHNWTSSA